MGYKQALDTGAFSYGTKGCVGTWVLELLVRPRHAMDVDRGPMGKVGIVLADAAKVLVSKTSALQQAIM